MKYIVILKKLIRWRYVVNISDIYIDSWICIDHAFVGSVGFLCFLEKPLFFSSPCSHSQFADLSDSEQYDLQQKHDF